MKYIAHAIIGAIFLYADAADGIDNTKNQVKRTICAIFGHDPVKSPSRPDILVCSRCGHTHSN